MSAWTLFTRLQGAISNGNDTNPETSNTFYNPPTDAYHNVVYYRRETVALDASDTRTIAFQDYVNTQIVLIVARVIGHAKISTTGIVGITAGYGTVDHPGIIAMTTFSIDAFTLTGLADGTTVEYLACIVVPDNDTALLV